MKRRTINTVIKMTIDEVFFNGDLDDFEPRVNDNLKSPKYALNDTDLRALAEKLNIYFDKLSVIYPNKVKPINPLLTPQETSNKNTVGKLRQLIQPRVSLFIAFFSLLFLISFGGEAEAGLYLEDYDLDNDPGSVSVEERRVFVTHQKFPFLTKVDRNKNGRIDPSELSALNAFIQNQADNRLDDMFSPNNIEEEDAIASSPLPIAKVQQALDIPPKPVKKEEQEKDENDVRQKPKYVGDSIFYLRKNRANVSIRKPSVTNNGAAFSFAQNFLTDSATGSVKAALGFMRNVAIDPYQRPGIDKGYLSAVALGGGLEIDRSWHPNGRLYQRDTLSVFLNSDLEFANTLFDLDYLSANIHFDTDTYFDKKVLGGGLSYQPYSTKMRQYKRLTDSHSLVFRLQPDLFLDYYHVFDKGVARYKAEEFLKLGFNVGATINLVNRDENRFVATLSSAYQGFWNASHDYDFSYKWNNKLSYWLDKDSTVSTDLTYNLEKDRITNTETNIFQIGLGIKF